MAKNIIQTAKEAGNFTKLIKAIDQAGIGSVLEGQGPYTVFAPSDLAFSKMPKDQYKDLMTSGNKKELANILKYHVVSGRVRSSQAKDMDVDTLSGQKAHIQKKGRTVEFAGAKVTNPDIECSNGVIHVIDRVAMPPKQRK